MSPYPCFDTRVHYSSLIPSQMAIIYSSSPAMPRCRTVIWILLGLLVMYVHKVLKLAVMDVIKMELEKRSAIGCIKMLRRDIQENRDQNSWLSTFGPCNCVGIFDKKVEDKELEAEDGLFRIVMKSIEKAGLQKGKKMLAVDGKTFPLSFKLEVDCTVGQNRLLSNFDLLPKFNKSREVGRLQVEPFDMGGDGP